jgi:hypothetical protein
MCGCVLPCAWGCMPVDPVIVSEHAAVYAAKHWCSWTTNRMTDEEALQGFPLHKRIKTALMGFMEGYARPPKGVNIQTIANLKERKWVTQSVEDYQAVYETTSEGRLAVQIDAIAIESGRVRPSPLSSMANAGMYHNLKERLEFLQIPNAKLT